MSSSNFRSAPWVLVGSGLAGLVSIGCGYFALHQQIKTKIDEVERLSSWKY